jgi:hypothetical protein
MKEVSMKQVHKLFVQVVIVFALILASVPLAAQQKSTRDSTASGAKDIFYDPATGATLKGSEKRQRNAQGRSKVRSAAATEVKFPGLHYWLELEGDGIVTDKRVFRTGNRIRLHVRSNVDGYFSVWALDSSGKGKVLFPPANAGMDNHVKADSEFALPGFIKFAPPAQEERMLIFFSRNKDDVPTAQDSVNESSRFLAQGQKSLEFETDDKNTAELGTYVVSRQGGAIAVVVRLQHK